MATEEIRNLDIMDLSSIYKKIKRAVVNCAACGGHVKQHLSSNLGICPTCNHFALIANLTAKLRRVLR
jgi:hypothetical protein